MAAAEAKMGDYPSAITIWKQAVQSNPGRTDLRLQLANAMWATKDYEGARSGYMQVLAKDHGNAEALNGMGIVYLRDNRLKEAELHCAHPFSRIQSSFRPTITSRSL